MIETRQFLQMPQVRLSKIDRVYLLCDGGNIEINSVFGLKV